MGTKNPFPGKPADRRPKKEGAAVARLNHLVDGLMSQYDVGSPSSPESLLMSRYCPQCGSLHAFDAVFCREDGNPLRDLSISTQWATDTSGVDLAIEDLLDQTWIQCQSCSRFYPPLKGWNE